MLIGFLVLAMTISPQEVKLMQDSMTVPNVEVRNELNPAARKYEMCLQNSIIGKAMIPSAGAMFEEGVKSCGDSRAAAMKDAGKALAAGSSLTRSQVADEVQKAFDAVDAGHRFLGKIFDEKIKRMTDTNVGD